MEVPGSAAPLVLGGIVGVSRHRLALAPLREGAPTLMETTGDGVPGGAIDPDLPRMIAEAVLGLLAAARRDGLLDHSGDAPPRTPAGPLACHLGITGLTGADRARVSAAIKQEMASRDPAWTVPIGIGDDLLPTFLTAGVGNDGVLLRAGTGAVGVRISGRRIIARRDGLGPLLGDVGSAVWLGRRTLQAVAADIDGRARRTRLTEQVGQMLRLDLREGRVPVSPTGDVRDDLARAVREIAPPNRPAALGQFAPLPGRVPEDPAAREILDAAMRHFAETVRHLDRDVELPVVLAGSVLATPGPIHDELVTGFTADGRDHREVLTGVPGALSLAREAAADRTDGSELSGEAD